MSKLINKKDTKEDKYYRKTKKRQRKMKDTLIDYPHLAYEHN